MKLHEGTHQIVPFTRKKEGEADKKPPKKGGDTLTQFIGEFMVSPIPLEMGGNRCSHNCPYCFANLNNQKRTFDLRGTLRLIENFESRKSLPAQLLRAGYPVLISNRVDPFAISNYRDFVPLMRRMVERGIPIALQTRGGRGIDEALEFLPPSTWYVSITHDRDETRAAIERQAPDIESRFELIRKLKRHGHRVAIGANPLVEDWIQEPETFFHRLRDAGAEGVWLEVLHLSYQQRNAMGPPERRALGEDLIKTAMKRKPNLDFLEKCTALAIEAGLEVYSIGQKYRSDYFRMFREVYPKTFPVIQDWVNHCHDSGIDTFDIDDWMAFFADKFPIVDSSQIYHYIEMGAQRKQTGVTIPKIRNYQDLLPLCWSHHKFPRGNPIFCDAFAYLAHEEKGEIYPEYCRELPVFAFEPRGTREYYSVRA